MSTDTRTSKRPPTMAMLGKSLHRRLLDVLSDRTTFLALIVCTALFLVTAFHFGEAWLQWSSDKYAAVFNSFSDNLAGN